MTWLHGILWQVSARCLQTHSELLGQPQCRTSHPPHKGKLRKTLRSLYPSGLPTKSFPKKKMHLKLTMAPTCKGMARICAKCSRPKHASAASIISKISSSWSSSPAQVVQVLGTRSTVFHCSKLPKWHLFGMNRIPGKIDELDILPIFPAKLQKPHFFAWFLFQSLISLRKL